MNQRIEFAKKLEIATSEKCAILSALEAKNDELMQLHCTINSFDQILMSYGYSKGEVNKNLPLRTFFLAYFNSVSLPLL